MDRRRGSRPLRRRRSVFCVRPQHSARSDLQCRDQGDRARARHRGRFEAGLELGTSPPGAERITFANADWGQADYLVNADAVEASISVLPLLIGRIVLPEVHLEGAEVALERDAEGRRNWILQEEEQKEEKSRFFIKLLTLDDGHLIWDDATTDTRIEADLSTDETGVNFAAQGKWKGMPLKTAGHAGQVLSIRDQDTPLPLKGEITIGKTSARLAGTLTGIVGFKGIDLQFRS